MNASNDLPVLIAGAGPAGCVAALALARAGIAVKLFEKQRELPVDLRASTLHPPSLDMLDKLGLTEKLIPQGLISPTYQYRDRRTNEIAEFDLSLLEGETKFPFRLQCEQYKLTRTAVPMLEAYPHVEVRFGAGAVGVEQDANGVTLRIDTEKGEVERVRGAFVIGADGASSAVRQSLGIEYEGFTYPEKFLVASTDFPIETRIPRLSNVNYVSDPDEWCVVLRTKDLWRVLFPTDPADSDETLLSDAFIQSRLVHLIGEQDAPYRIAHRTLYRVHQRVAETYRIGRVALVGDAAHINNPLGGMGMNGGLHDAISLAEKLIDILQNGASMDLLDRYDRQRRVLATQFVNEHTIRNKQMMEAKDPEVQRKRQQDFMRTAADPVLAKKFLMKNSMIDAVRQSWAIE